MDFFSSSDSSFLNFLESVHSVIPRRSASCHCAMCACFKAARISMLFICRPLFFKNTIEFCCGCCYNHIVKYSHEYFQDGKKYRFRRRGGDMMTKRKYDVSEVTAKIRLLKEEKGVTLQEIATGAGIGLSTVKQYVTGKRIPDQFNLKRIADYFGVLDDWIIGKSPYRNIFEQFDAKIGEEGLFEIRKEVAFWNWLEENFDFDFSQYSPEQLEKLDHDIREYIQFKIDQLKKEG